MTYRIKKSEIIKNLSFSFFLIFLGFSCVLFKSRFPNFFDVKIILLIIGILLAISLLLLLDYIKNATKGSILIGANQIEIIDSNCSEVISKNEIKSVIVFCPPSVKRRSDFKLLPFEAFHYIEIKCRHRPNIIITSLCDYNLYETITKETLFEEILFFNRAGLSGNGSLINSIWLNKLK